MINVDPDLKNNKLATYILFDFDTVWNKKSEMVIKILGYNKD